MAPHCHVFGRSWRRPLQDSSHEQRLSRKRCCGRTACQLAFSANGLDRFDDGWFRAGKLAFTSGANDGLSVEVKNHRNDGAVTIELWQVMPEPIAAGDTFVISAGCDKRFQTCHERFNNIINFRGFPHIPGNDFVVSYPLCRLNAVVAGVDPARVGNLLSIRREDIVAESRENL